LGTFFRNFNLGGAGLKEVALLGPLFNGGINPPYIFGRGPSKRNSSKKVLILGAKTGKNFGGDYNTFLRFLLSFGASM